MSQTLEDRYTNGHENRYFAAETPFFDPRQSESLEEPLREAPYAEAGGGSWEIATPFMTGEWGEAGESEAAAPEVAALAELATEMKDADFREALEQLADEALEAHAERLAGEYGDRETREAVGERLLNEHFQPLAVQTENLLDRFFERLEGYGAEALTETEVDRIIGEVLPEHPAISPAQEQFLGGLFKKIGKIVTAPIKLVGKGLALASKVLLGPLLAPLKKLARFLLGHVVKWAMNKIPAQYRPLARKLSERLFHELGDGHEAEAEEHVQTEAEAIPAGPDVARLEAEFDLHAAQLLLTSDEAETEQLVSSYGESYEAVPEPALAALDHARAELTEGLSRLQPGESAQPLMENFLPVVAAVWPALKGAIGLIGRPKVVKFIGGLLAKLIQPILGPEFANVLGPVVADVGMKIFGFEIGQIDPRAVTTEALAATIEETLTRLGELPPHVFENETLLEDAVREAFEDAAAGYFPAAVIKPELRETAEQRGMWRRMPEGSSRKRYARHTDAPEVTITPRVAAAVKTFDGSTLHDHIRDRMGVPHGQPLKTRIRLFKALPGTTLSHVARAEKIPPGHLYPLTHQAAGALLGKNSGLAPQGPSGLHPGSPHRLQLHQRLYYLEPPSGRQNLHHRHRVRLARAELILNMRSSEIRVWLYLSERLCQHVSAELAKPHNVAAAFRLIKPLVHRPADMMREIVLHRHLPLTLRVIEEVPNFDARTPQWLVHVARQLGAKLEQWTSQNVVQYLRNNAEEFRRLSASQHDGVTLKITLSRIPGFETLRTIARGRIPKLVHGGAWLEGTPAFAVHARAGYAIR